MLSEPLHLLEQTKGVEVTLGVAGLICVVVWPLLATYRNAVAVQCAGAAAFAAHFALLGSPAASAVCLVSFVQLIFSASVNDRRIVIGLYAASVVLMAVIVAATWHGVSSALAAGGSIAGTAARLQRSTVRMKAIFLFGGPFWLAHDLILGAIFPLGVDAVSIIGNGMSLVLLSRRGTWSFTGRLRVATFARRQRDLLALPIPFVLRRLPTSGPPPRALKLRR